MDRVICLQGIYFSWFCVISTIVWIVLLMAKCPISLTDKNNVKLIAETEFQIAVIAGLS